VTKFLRRRKPRKEVMKVELTFTEPLLGTVIGNKEIFEEFIESKNPKGIESKNEEIDALPEIEKASTAFARDIDGKPMLWDYQIKGFFKEACHAMIDTDTLTNEELKSVRLTGYLHKRTIDRQIFVMPRRIKLNLPNGDGKLPFCGRPLRGETKRGEYIALARSEEAPVGTKIEIEIITLNKKLNNFIMRWLDYGALLGMGQWRNSGKGRFSWKELKSE